MKYPLRESSMRRAFGALGPAFVAVMRRNGLDEGFVYGEWRLTKLKAHFKSLGFMATGRREDLLFVNAEGTVGLQCMGVTLHATKNTWATYYVEVQARPKAVKADDGMAGVGLTIWGC